MGFLVGLAVSMAFAAQPVTNTLLGEQVRPLVTQDGLIQLEKARLEALNTDSDQEVVWKDPKNDISGAFKVIARFKNKQNQQQCREYAHMLRKRDGQAILSRKTHNPLAYKATACYSGRGWEKFEGDRANLVGVSGTATPSASATSGATGPEHRLQYPNMVDPKILGTVLDNIKLFKKYIDAEKEVTRKDQYREQMYTWLGKLADEMKQRKKTLALDQLAILLGQVDGETAKTKVIEILKPRLVQIGDPAKKKGDSDLIARTIRDNVKRAETERIFAQLPEKIND